MSKINIFVKYLLNCAEEKALQANEMLASDSVICTLINSEAYELLQTELTDIQKCLVQKIVEERLLSLLQDIMEILDNNTSLSDDIILSLFDSETNEELCEDSQQTFFETYFEEFDK